MVCWIKTSANVLKSLTKRGFDSSMGFSWISNGNKCSLQRHNLAILAAFSDACTNASIIFFTISIVVVSFSLSSTRYAVLRSGFTTILYDSLSLGGFDFFLPSICFIYRCTHRYTTTCIRTRTHTHNSSLFHYYLSIYLFYSFFLFTW